MAFPEPADEPADEESGQLFEVFAPDDAAVAEADGLGPTGPTGPTLAEMSEKQLTTYRQQRHSAFKAHQKY